MLNINSSDIDDVFYVNPDFTLGTKDFPKEFMLAMFPTGSKYICSPPVLTTDEDYFVYSGRFTAFTEYLLGNGWEPCTGAFYPCASFQAYRKGVHNLIVIKDADEYWTRTAITELAKRLNLTNKQDRVDLFNLVINGAY